MKSWLPALICLIAFCSLSLAQPSSGLTEKELADGWISLFDGNTLYGWRAASDANWSVKNGAIRVSGGKPGLLRTTSQFSDYQLRLEFRSAKGTNSGVFLHTPPRPKNPTADCYELNIADSDNAFPTGSLVGRKKVVGNHDSTEWQQFDVTVKGGQLTVKLDGKQVMVYKDAKPLRRGFIGLQLNQGLVEFRKIHLKPLSPSRLFDGKSLAKWNQYPAMQGRFSIRDKERTLHVQDGPGQLETKDKYGDFVLQLECRTNAANLNSGIFYRCIPGEKMNGYESQIHNGFEDGDRRKPKDTGTGGIFRRTKARIVAADDLKWFHKTIIAVGPHVAVWVNGYQVSDWTDKRKPNDNPRRGLRLAPGTIMIQAHDPTTDIDFRKIQISEIAKRQR